MLSRQQREFGLLAIRAITRAMKLVGVVEAITEAYQLQGHIPVWLIDHYYDRWYRFEDALTRLKATAIWRSVDVDDVTSEGSEDE